MKAAQLDQQRTKLQPKLSVVHAAAQGPPAPYPLPDRIHAGVCRLGSEHHASTADQAQESLVAAGQVSFLRSNCLAPPPSPGPANGTAPD
jgi:hypothetical protein